MKTVKAVVMLVAIVALAASPALAQSPAAPRLSVSLGSGAASTTSATGATFSGSMLFDLSRRATVEAEARYLDRGPGADALNASANLMFDLVRTNRRMVPFAMVGAGVHRASFNLNHPQFLGGITNQFQPGSEICPAHGTGVEHHAQGWPGHMSGTWPHTPGSGPHPMTPIEGMPCSGSSIAHWGTGHMPDFYARRMGTMIVPQNGTWGSRSFMDPMMSVGGGMKVRTVGRMTVRVDARALIVFDAGNTHTVGVFGFNVGYRF